MDPSIFRTSFNLKAPSSAKLFESRPCFSSENIMDMSNQKQLEVTTSTFLMSKTHLIGGDSLKKLNGTHRNVSSSCLQDFSGNILHKLFPLQRKFDAALSPSKIFLSPESFSNGTSQTIVINSKFPCKVLSKSSECLEFTVPNKPADSTQLHKTISLEKEQILQFKFSSTDCPELEQDKVCILSNITNNPSSSVESSVDDIESGEDVKSMPCDLLSMLIQDKSTKSKVLLIDCRTFVSFNANHVTGALNISCSDFISRKRLMCGKATVGDLINGAVDAKELYKKALENTRTELLLYDDDTVNFQALPATHPLKVVASCLKKAGRFVCFLFGGLQEFHKNYSHLCSKPLQPLSPPMLYSPTTPIVDCSIDNATISQILPFLFIGNERDAASKEILTKHKITHILNITAHLPLHWEGEDILYRRLPASDSGCQNLKQYFSDAIQFIDDAAEANGNVLIHCQAGVSRSPTIAIAYIMAHSSLGMMSAFRFVKSKRPIVAPNFNFLGQLYEYEGRLSEGARDVQLDEYLSAASNTTPETAES